MLLPRLLRSARIPPSLTAQLTARASRLPARSLATTCVRQNLWAEDELMAKLPPLDASKLNVTETITPKQLVPNQDLVFGRTFTGSAPRPPRKLY
jgi:branched-chain amino acid aminotransferase